ncbi:MAG: hypothetical protein E7L01_16530 [Paenibacillus macerans]|uniref:Uncharacterized protein n=1 Tax=Paenibacillus macerans TaxID=44252 RepID=A0A090YR24_PAEMA|nr:hypothetical protein [Paenibacillus macerans]KFM94545.1 hypothetical protein DJ90_1475 [Paenibacillus macerans]MBS5913351.1 hypothetical protein [Paenibacillus macerans]MCY7561268.1 hypothetical protein [Paenibacillus macerans]MDU7474914.1 hypothetical protein [Paenibacillus macerans]MEC0137648.1 hypothetical protein [Paenibacillus macerans]
MKKRIIYLLAAIFALIVLFSIFIYPSFYKYMYIETDNGKFPVRINVITQNAEILTLDGWLDIVN